MFRLASFIAVFAFASAFSPIGRVATKTVLSMQFEDTLGAQPPLGFWDPLNLLKDANEEYFDRLRATEIKHGRISMLAILGHMATTAGWRLPGEIAYGTPFTDVKAGLAAFENIPAGGVLQLLLFIGALEIGFGSKKERIEEKCYDYMDAIGWSDSKQLSKRAIELNNGRAAQMGILALMVHEKLDNNPYIINDLLGSPVPFN